VLTAKKSRFLPFAPLRVGMTRFHKQALTSFGMTKFYNRFLTSFGVTKVLKQIPHFVRNDKTLL
jgi:hypothetical protein